MKVLIFYDSFTGNTEQVVNRIFTTLKSERDLLVEKIKASKDFTNIIDMLKYDLVFIGSPVIQFLPSINLMNFCKKHLMYYLKKGIIIPKSPKFNTKYAVPFVTFGGMHTGIREAIPALKYLEQFLEHLRFQILDSFYVIGEYRAPKFAQFNKDTCLGDITGRPNEKDLNFVETKVRNIIKKLRITKQQNFNIHVPKILKFLENDYPDLKEPLFNFIAKNKQVKAITEKETVLIMIALACASKCKECLRHHITNALNIGVTVEEIKDVFLTGFLVAGASFINFGVEVLEEIGVK